jgi:hypothetical protein
MNTATVVNPAPLSLLLDGVAAEQASAVALADPYARWHGHVVRAVVAAGKAAAVSTFVGNRVNPVWGTTAGRRRR